MANRRDFFFKQRVTEGELDDSNLQLELADHDIKKDAFCGANGFLMANVTVVQELAGTLRIDIGTGLGWDKDGQRVENPNASTFEDLSTHQDGALQVDVNVYMQFDRFLSDPRTDGLGNTVNFKRDESFQIVVDPGAPGGGPPALDPTKGIFLAEVAIPASPGVITNAEIDTSGQNLKSDFPTSRLKDFDPGAFTADGYIGELKILTDRGPGVPPGTYKDLEVEFCRVMDSTGTKVLSPPNNTIMDPTVVGAGGIDLGVPAVNNLTIDTWYYLFAIGDSNLVSPDSVLLSLNPGAPFGADPTLPGGYDLFRRIGAFRTDSTAPPNTNWIPGRKIGRIFLYEEIQPIFGFGGAVGRGLVAGATRIAPTVERALFHLSLVCTGANFGASVNIFAAASNPVSAAPQIQLVVGGGGAGAAPNGASGAQGMAEVDAAQMIELSVGNPGPSGIAGTVHVAGYIDDLKHA